MTRKRTRGRPSLEAGVRSVEVFTHITEPDRLALQAIATANRSTLPAVIRTALQQFIRQRRRVAPLVTVAVGPRRPRPVIKRGGF